jgi:hypothetical protein
LLFKKCGVDSTCKYVLNKAAESTPMIIEVPAETAVLET